MPGKSSLPSGWQAALENPAGSQFYFQVYIDPSGENIVLNEENGLISIDPIPSEIDIDPEFQSEIKLNGLRLTFADPNEFYKAITSRSSRRFKNVQRITSQSTSSNPVGLETGLGTFAIGDVCTITDGNNKEQFTANSAATNSVGWSGSLGNTYAAGSMISTAPIVGLYCEVKMSVVGESGTLTVFKGVVKESFLWQGDRAVLVLDNYLYNILKKPLRIISTSDSPTDRALLNGSLGTSFVWNSGHSTELSGVTVYAGAIPGQWTVTIGENNSIQVTGPGDVNKSGNTDTDFYDNTDATDSQIKIPTANWSSVTEGDQLTFYVSVNFQGMTVPQIADELLDDYGELSTSEIDVGGTGVTDGTALTYTFNKVHNTISDEVFTISYNEDTTIMQAILVILPHSLCYIGQKLNGKIGIITLHPDFYMEAITPDLIEQPVVERSEVFNEFIINYAYNYVDGVYEHQRIYPALDSENASRELFSQKKSITLNLPAVPN